MLGLFLLLLAVGCASVDEDRKDGGLQNDEVDETVETELASETRKIIYEVDAKISVEDSVKAYNEIKSKLNADEWFDSERIVNDTIYLVIRIKSSRLDEFISSNKSYGTVNHFEKNATDVSLNYQNKENRIASLEAELERLN